MARSSPRSSAARWQSHGFLVLLLVVYVVATFFPAPAWIAVLRVPCGPFAAAGERLELGVSKLILAGLLFLAGVRTAVPSWPGRPLQSFSQLAMGFAGRLIPLAAMIALTHLFAWAAVPMVAMDVATGLMLVAAMPSANTSTAWTRRSGGSLPLCVALVLLTTAASPIVVPTTSALSAGPAATMAGAGGRSLPAVGVELISWVVIPMAVGMAAGRLWSASGGTPRGRVESIGSLAAILAVNYLNASRGLPGLLVDGTPLPVLGAAVAGAVLVASTYGGAGLIARVTDAAPPAALALAYAVGMSNTGLAGALASEAFSDHPVILYPIVLCTLAQHAMAAVIDGSRRDANPSAAVAAAR